MKTNLIYLTVILLIMLFCSGCKKDKEIEVVIPSAPASLQAVPFSSSQINLAWTDKSNNETGFKIERSLNSTTSWSEIASLSSNITAYQNTGLTPSTTYYYRVKAFSASGSSGYSSTANATTPGVEPKLTTTTVTNITATTATGGGNISSEGGAAVSARGVCWSTSQNPTTSSSKTIDGTGTGSFTSNITGLSPGTLYYLRAYATNSIGTGYGEQVNFTTASNIVPPTLTTATATNVNNNSASSGGNITNDGGGAITARGVCWSTSQSPTTANSKTSNGTGTGTFTSSITGLVQGTLYYARAYATNSAGTSYGNQISFTTTSVNIVPPTLTTTAATNISNNSATSGGNITGDGGAAVTARGVCWGTSQNPTTANSKTSDGTGTGSFVSSVTGLTAGTVYYLKAFATNSAGTAYGPQVSFTTLTNPVPPVFAATVIKNITTTTATAESNITSDGGSAITAKGVCWSTSQNPTTANSKTSDGTGTGAFTSSIAGLTPATLYYVRTYATNSLGTAYGAQVSFTTLANPVLPTLTTTAISNIMTTTASSGGNITSDGGAPVTARGVCWSTSQNPTTANSKTSDGTGTGVFTSSLTSLTPGTLYYVRAYATNSTGTAYGNQLSFTTLSNIVPPTVTTTAVTNITTTTATSGGNVTGDGGASVSERGVCWSTTQNPTISNNKTSNGTGTGVYTSSLTSLTPGTLYYVRAYATNSAGTGYGTQVQFTTNQAATAPILTGPASATGPFNLTWTFAWPGTTALDDHYELEYSYSSTSGFIAFNPYPNGVRTSPYTDIITPEAVDIGKISYFRVRAKSAGTYTPYSNIIAVNIPYVNLTFNPTIDNLLMKQSNNTAVETTVYSTSSLSVGANYIIGLYVSDYIIGASTMYFNIDNYISGGTIQKATLRLYVSVLPADWNTNYIVNALGAAWNTNTITFTNVPSYFTSPYTIKAPPTTGAIPWEVDITSIVQAWANGTRTNYGLLLRDNNIAWPANTAYRATSFYSIETAPSGKKPQLYIEIR